MSFYEIRVKGHLDPRWSEWFDGLQITNEPNGEALLSGHIPDQAALHGVLARVRDLNYSSSQLDFSHLRAIGIAMPLTSMPQK